MLTIAQITDLHIHDELACAYGTDARQNTLTILDDIAQHEIQDVLITGDLGSGGVVAWLQEELAARGLQGYFALGNHDRAQDFRDDIAWATRLLDDAFVYELSIRHIEMLILDSSREELGPAQIAILRDYLQHNPSSLIVCHHPVLDCGNTPMDKQYPLRDRAEVLTVLQEQGRDVTLICGHYHNAYTVRTGHITQYVTPSACAQFSSHGEHLLPEGNAFGYRIFDFSDHGLSTDVIWLT